MFSVLRAATPALAHRNVGVPERSSVPPESVPALSSEQSVEVCGSPAALQRVNRLRPCTQLSAVCGLEVVVVDGVVDVALVAEELHDAVDLWPRHLTGQTGVDLVPVHALVTRRGMDR